MATTSTTTEQINMVTEEQQKPTPMQQQISLAPTNFRKVFANNSCIICQCMDTQKSSQPVIAKIILHTPENEHINACAHLENEFNLLQSVNHPNIAKAYSLHKSVLLQRGNVKEHCCIMLMEQGKCDLFTLCTKYNLSISTIRQNLKEVLEALCHMHDNNYSHNDVKLENILVMQKNSSWKLADFGLSHDHNKELQQNNTPVMQFDRNVKQIISENQENSYSAVKAQNDRWKTRYRGAMAPEIFQALEKYKQEELLNQYIQQQQVKIQSEEEQKQHFLDQNYSETSISTEQFNNQNKKTQITEEQNNYNQINNTNNQVNTKQYSATDLDSASQMNANNNTVAKNINNNCNNEVSVSAHNLSFNDFELERNASLKTNHTDTEILENRDTLLGSASKSENKDCFNLNTTKTTNTKTYQLFDEKKVDMFQFGVMLFQILFLKSPWEDDQICAQQEDRYYGRLFENDLEGFWNQPQLREPLKYRMRQPDNRMEELMDLLSALLEVNPDKRISAREALNHPWFYCPNNNNQEN